MKDRNRRLRELIREYRELRRLSQEEVAQMIGISRLSYHRVENGTRRLDKEELKAVCSAIGVNPDALLREAGFTAIT
jgi:transcriptional regulator with XRE-family HTH domain